MQGCEFLIAACVLPQTAALVGIRPSPVHRNARLAATAWPRAERRRDQAAPRASKAQWAQLNALVRKDWPLLEPLQ